MRHARVGLWLLLVGQVLSLAAAEPLRVYLRGGPKTHGPAGNGLHDHERWVQDWAGLLKSRGAEVRGGLSFPSAHDLAQSDLLVMFAANAGDLDAGQRASLDGFLQRGGGLVCFHDAVCGHDPQWFKTVIGGAWEHNHSKWYEGEISFYYVDQEHPITRGASNFDIDDEIYWDLHLMPGARVLGASWQPDARRSPGGKPRPHIYGVIPQMWVYETNGYRAFVSLLGHKYPTFEKPHVRAVLLRGLAWAARREVDSLCRAEELAALRYPQGGPTAPAEAAGLLEVHPEFRLGLAAAEPLINKPISLDWDPAGRLWVAETPEYPNGRRGLRPDMAGQEWKDHGGLVAVAGKQDRPARDRISILLDTDQDGTMDRKEVFYEGLELVTGFVFHRDGVIAAAAPDIFWLRDMDGDGKAERVEKLYTGLGTSDTHAVINNLRWGMDGWVYATHGYSAGTVTSPDGTKHFGRIGSGVVRFKPDGSAFEQFSSKGGNTWGLDVAWDNEVFFTQPTSGDLLNHVVLSESVLARGKAGSTPSFKPIIQRRPSVPLLKSEQMAYVQIDQVGYFTASAGCAIYDGGAWPKEWDYAYFTTEPTINLVHHEAVQAAGVSYDARKTREPEFIGGRDLWFRPIETRIGPDGALYVLDFYNQAVIHNDTRGPTHNQVNAAVRPDRDHYFGRIWRVTHQKSKGMAVPDLNAGTEAQWLQALKHPNAHVRMNAFRLLCERGGAEARAGLEQMARSSEQTRARVLALWVLAQQGAVSEAVLVSALRSSEAAVRKNALRVAQAGSAPGAEVRRATAEALKDPEARVRLEGILALGRGRLSEAEAAALLDVYPSLQDRWLESAAMSVMASAPAEFLDAALSRPEVAGLTGLVEALAGQVGAAQDAVLAARVVRSAASKPAGADALKAVLLTRLAKDLRAEVVPGWDSALEGALGTLVQSTNAWVAAAALPLVVRWDQGRVLAGRISGLVASLLERFVQPGLEDGARLALARSLLGLRQSRPEVVPAVAGVLTTDASAELKRQIIEALGSTADLASGQQLIAAYSRLDPVLQDVVLGQILKRADWSQGFVAAVRSGQVPHAGLRPSAVHQLRQHSDRQVAAAAQALFDDLRGPELKERNQLIAQLTAVVQEPGDAARGRDLFVQNCANCHQYGDLGRPVGPNLNGMGAHGPAELLVHIVDPNRAVEDSYVAQSIETKDDEIVDGVLVRENAASVFLRNAAGEVEIAKTRIQKRRSTGQSLMPNGFEALGGEGLRDLLSFMTLAERRYRFLDLSGAFTADTRKGLYLTPDNPRDSLQFKKYGVVTVEGVPFNIVDPARNAAGRNVIVLKGGETPQAFAKTFPRRVEIPVGLPVAKLHFLGGVGGWAYPWGGEPTKDVGAMKLTVVYGDGQQEEATFKNGVEFADWVRDVPVPGSQLAAGVVSESQVRWFTRSLARPGRVERLVLESFDNHLAPTTVAITVELAGNAGSAAGGDQASSGAQADGNGNGNGDANGAAKPSTRPIRVLIVGGGSSHDFEKWFHQADKATLAKDGLATVRYTEQAADIASALPDLDVLYLSNNQPIPDAAARQAIFQFADAGRGLLLVHPAVWYNWKDWPEYNRLLAGGGSRGHDRYGEFEVTTTQTKHAVTEGVPSRFTIRDELYWFEPDTSGTAIEVLATAHSKQKDKTYPMVWVVRHAKARIVCIALGHDAAAHEHPAYQTLLRNALKWANGAGAK